MRFSYIDAARPADDEGRIPADYNDGAIVSCNACGAKRDVRRDGGRDREPHWYLRLMLADPDGYQLELVGEVCFVCRCTVPFGEIVRALAATMSEDVHNAALRAAGEKP